jgi:hypothetical protein
MAHLLHDLVLKESRQLRRALGSARWAQSSFLAGTVEKDMCISG